MPGPTGSTVLEPTTFDELHDGVEPIFKWVAGHSGNNLSDTFCIGSVSKYTRLKRYAAGAFTNDHAMKSVALKLGLRYF